MDKDLDQYVRKVVLPCRGFNLWHYLSTANPTEWNFEKIREELALIESLVQSVPAGRR